MRITRLNQIVKDGKTVKGTWKLTRDHELRYLREGAREQVVVSGPLVGADARGIRFRAESRSVDGDAAGRELEIKGRWESDSRNRLVFLAAKEDGGHDRLRLEGGWETDHDQGILYRYQQEDLKTKRKALHMIRFHGMWEVGDDRRLVFVLDRSSDSAFRFRGAFQTNSVLAKDGQLRYQFGAEVDGRGRRRAVTLFGKWKISRSLALSFEIPYGDGRVSGIDFGADLGFLPGGELSCRLLTRKGKPLGVEVLFTREFLEGDAELFARLRRLGGETAVEGGVRLRW